LSMQLVGTVRDRQLFTENISKFGKLFYREEQGGRIVDVVYFSGTRAMKYVGEIDQELAAVIKAQGFKVESLEFDEKKGVVRVSQVKPA